MQSEVDKWFSRCGDWYEVAELKQQRIAELKAEVERYTILIIALGVRMRDYYLTTRLFVGKCLRVYN